MFFSITQKYSDSRFTTRHSVGDFYVHLDAGWTKKIIKHTTVFFKGYCDNNSLENILHEFIKNPIPKYTGNFCIIVAEPNSLTVTHDINRSFPLFYYRHKHMLTNLLLEDIDNEKIFSDCYIKFNKNEIQRYLFDCIGSVNTNKISKEQCINGIIKNLNKKTLALKKYNNIKIFLSGGVNTTLCYSLLKNILSDSQLELINYEHFEYDKFTLRNKKTLKTNYWAYNQINYWSDKQILASGSCGDEFFMRGPATAGLWAAWHNINLLDELQFIEHSYHKKYFLKEKNAKIFSDQWNSREIIQNKYKSVKDLNRQILNMNVNDHQHWHLGNTLTWTPFKDIEITKLILSLNVDDILRQIIYADIDHWIIKNLSEDLLPLISRDKNINSMIQLENLKGYCRQ